MRLLAAVVAAVASLAVAEVEAMAAAFKSDLYARVGRAAPSDVVPLVVGLRAEDFSALERRLWQVADPTYVPVEVSEERMRGRLT
jgi:hypothetical protein